MTKLKLGAKLGVAFAAMALLTILLGVFAISRLSMIQTALVDLGDNSLPSVVLIYNIKGKVNDVRRLETQFLVADATEQATLKGRIEVAANEAKDLLKSYEPLISTREDGDLFKDDVAKTQLYLDITAKLIPMAMQGEQGLKDAIALLFAESRKNYNAASNALDEHIKLNVKMASDAGSAGKASASVARLATEIAIGVVVVLALVLGWVVTGMIVRPVRKASEAAAVVASGNLSVAIDAQGHDEIADLLRSIQTMQQSLSTTVAAVRQGSEGVATASAEIAQGNSDLSSRTESQASALEETAASMEQLSSQVEQNADNARQASQLASGASAIAARGGAVVSRVVETMKEINDSSKRIADIIQVIDGIAFQTNILALNAAVEAARAGDQGRGFAVVASEVRSLAGRSAEAAKEIKSLINASVERVEHGTVLVDEAGTTMTEVVGSIRRVSDLVSEISSASTEQSAGVAQVGEAVTQMDQATQQNAALVEQMAAAASSLKSQANELVNTVSVFKLDAGYNAINSTPTKIASVKATFKEANRRNITTTHERQQLATRPSIVKSAAIPKSMLATKETAEGKDDDWETF